MPVGIPVRASDGSIVNLQVVSSGQVGPDGQPLYQLVSNAAIAAGSTIQITDTTGQVHTAVVQPSNATAATSAMVVTDVGVQTLVNKVDELLLLLQAWHDEILG